MTGFARSIPAAWRPRFRLRVTCLIRGSSLLPRLTSEINVMAGLAQRVIRALCPKWQTSIESESRDWVMRCPCGAETSVWEMGGIRYKAAGNPLRNGRCGTCGNVFVGQVYRKSAQAADDGHSETRYDSSTILPLKDAAASPPQAAAVRTSEAGLAGLLWIDGAGCYRIVAGDHISLGSHSLDAEGADLRLLAPIGRKQALISRSGEAYWLQTEGATTGVVNHGAAGGRLLRSGEVFEIGGGVRLRLRTPNSLSNTAVLEFVSSHRPVQRIDGVILLEQVCILGPAEDAHIRCPQWQHPVVLFQRDGQLWCKAAPGLQLNGAEATGEFVLADGGVLTGEDLRLRVELSCD